MKQLVLILTFVSLLLSSQAQVIDSISIIAIDNIGNKDTVLIGLAYNGATDGVDELLGEIDISSQPYSNLDIRSIQRTTTMVDDFWLAACPDGHVKPFEQELELKKDIRHDFGINHFILKIHAINYPVILKFLYQGNFNIFGSARRIPVCLYDKNLNVTKSSYIDPSKETSDTIFVLNNEESNGLVSFHPQVIVGIEEGFKDEETKLFPNPGSDYIRLQLKSKPKYKLRIYNMYGKIMDVISSEGVECYINISNYPSGEYFVRNEFTTYRFIKK